MTAGALRRLASDRRGSILLLSAVAMLALLLMAGLALDTTRLWLVRTRLQHAVDAAALLGAYEIGVSSQVADTKALFWVNYSSSAASTGTGYLGSTSSGATVTQVDAAHVQVSAQANVPLALMQLGGAGSITVSAATAIAAKGSGYEIALALDITGSMNANSGTAGTTKEQALQTAAQDMLDVVYGTSNDTVQNLSVSVVPFRGSVNIGTAHQAWTNYVAANWSAQSWRGCVEARTGGYDITEDNPGTRKFASLYWASTYNTVLNDATKTAGDYYPGDNDWTSSGVTDTGGPGNSLSSYSGLPVGPNLGCSNGVVLPLTLSKSTVKSSISGLAASSGGSTVLSQGLQWAWFTLSPVWQGYWRLAASPVGLSRPLAYGTIGNFKVVILMTDGNDEWDGNEQTSQNSGCNTKTVVPECTQADGYYTSYGRLSANRLNIAMPANGNSPSSNSTASNQASTKVIGAASDPSASNGLDPTTLTVCSAMKAQGIIIYTIAFQAANGSDAQTLLQGCASDAAHYYNTTTGSDIDAAFTSIGQQLITLRLTQ